MDNLTEKEKKENDLLKVECKETELGIVKILY